MQDGLLTVTQLCDELSVSRQKIDYVLRTRRIRPTDRLGSYKLFDGDAVRQIRGALQEVSAGRLKNRALQNERE